MRDHQVLFFCEVKTVARDEWLKQQLNAVPPGTLAGGARKDPIFNHISNKIHEAVQQFDAVNSDLKYPNVLIFVNHDDQCNFLDLVAINTGYFLAESGRKYPIYLQFSEGQIREEKYRIHLYIWIDEFNKTRYFFKYSYSAAFE